MPETTKVHGSGRHKPKPASTHNKGHKRNGQPRIVHEHTDKDDISQPRTVHGQG